MAARVAMRGQGPGDIDHMHEAPAQQIAQRVRVVGQHHLCHLRLRIFHRARNHAVAVVRSHASYALLKVYSQSQPASLSAIPIPAWRERDPYSLKVFRGEMDPSPAGSGLQKELPSDYRNRLAYRSRSPLSLEINGQVTLSLALYAGIVEGCLPTPRSTVVGQSSLPGRGMSAVVDVVKQDFIVLILGNGEADGVSQPLGGQPAAGTGVTEVAEIAQRRIIGGEFSSLRAAYSAEAGAQRQPIRERPGDCETSLRRKEEGAGHDSNLSSRAADCVKFFYL